MARPKIIAGIDIGTEKICTLIASLSAEDQKISVLGVASQSSLGLRKSQIVDIEEAINSITESVEAAERMAGYSINDAFISISGTHIQSQNSKGVVAVSEPDGEINPDDVERVIEAARAISLSSDREILHVIPRDFIVDSQEGIKDPVGMSGVRLEAEAHIITGSSTAMRNMAKCVGELGINVSGLVFSGLASSYTTLSDTEKELGVVLIDIGGGTTSLTVIIEGTLAYSTVLPVGARNITNDLAIGMRVSLESAEKIKLALSQSSPKPQLPKDASDKDIKKEKKKADEVNLTNLGLKEDIKTASRKTLVEGIIRPRLNEIFTMIGKELKKKNFVGLTPAGVVLTGGGAETVGIVDSCKRILTVPTRIGTPTGLSGLVEEIQTSAYAASTGLIIYGAHNQVAESGGFSFKGVSRLVNKLPGKGVVPKVIDFFRSFLP